MDPQMINLTGLYRYLEKQDEDVLWNKKVVEGFQDLILKVLKWNNALNLEEGSFINFQEAIDNVKRELGDSDLGDNYEVTTISGKPKTRELPQFNLENPRLNLVLNGIVEISKSVGPDGIPDEDSPYARLYEIKAIPVTSHEKNHECTHEDPPWQLWEDSWDKGEWDLNGKYWDKSFQDGQIVWKFLDVQQSSKETKEGKEHLAAIWKKLSEQLTTLVQRHGDSLKNVDKVICFGLGSLHVGKARTFIQHKAAATVAKALNELREGEGIFTPVTILAQDPAYCSNCSKILKDRFKIKTTTAFDGFTTIDESTFVITFAPTGPICPIIADVTRDFGGPAAMLCDKIESDYLMPEKKPEGKWIDNEPTKNLVEYKEACHFENFSDVGDIWKDLLDRLENDREKLRFYGEGFSNKKMSREEFLDHEVYGQAPTKANRPETMGDDEFKLWRYGHANKVRECFPECSVYVRKV